MALYTISDLHLSLSSDKPMDIFRGWEGYVYKLKSNWLKTITADDTVVIPGDISWEMRIKDTYADFKFINDLPGRKILMKGNHDLWWDSVTKMNRFFDEQGFEFEILHNNSISYGDYALAGSRGWYFDDNSADTQKILSREAARVERSIIDAEQMGKEVILFLHYPPATLDGDCEPIMRVIKEHNIKKCYYGHIHHAGCAKAINGEYKGVYLRCVSCDVLGFSPLKIAE